MNAPHIAAVLQFPGTPTVEDRCRELLTIKRQIAALKARADVLEAALLPEVGDPVVVPGLGSVSVVVGHAQTRLDTSKAQALLEEHGIEVPLTLSSVRPSVRCTLNK